MKEILSHLHKTGRSTRLLKAKEEFEKGYLIQLLTQVRGNVVQAAKLAQRY